MGPEPVRARIEQPSRSPDQGAEPPARELRVQGALWLVRELGRTRTGHPGDSGAILLHLGFREHREQEDRTDDEDGAEPDREGWLSSLSLAVASDQELLESFLRSRTWTRPTDEGGSSTRSVARRQRLRTAGADKRR